jgi:diguanylate cyclase (GGDEF)-like protein
MPDFAARYGGEEFIILLPETNAAAAHALAERIQQKVLAHQWDHAPLTLSIGIATLSKAATSGEQLVRDADAALYEAKRTGKDKIILAQ